MVLYLISPISISRNVTNSGGFSAPERNSKRYCYFIWTQMRVRRLICVHKRKRLNAIIDTIMRKLVCVCRSIDKYKLNKLDGAVSNMGERISFQCGITNDLCTMNRVLCTRQTMYTIICLGENAVFSCYFYTRLTEFCAPNLPSKNAGKFLVIPTSTTNDDPPSPHIQWGAAS